jgi:Ca2+-binding EF-hand superfamily protein
MSAVRFQSYDENSAPNAPRSSAAEGIKPKPPKAMSSGQFHPRYIADKHKTEGRPALRLKEPARTEPARTEPLETLAAPSNAYPGLDNFSGQGVQNLPATHMEDLQDVFAYLDLQGDKSLPVSSLGLGLRAAGIKIRNAEVQRLQQHLQQQGKKAVTFQEFASIWTSYADGMSGQAADEHNEAIFNVFDPMGSGYFNADMFVHAMSTLGEKMDPDEIREVLQDADMLGDGMVDLKRFASVLNMHSGPLM